MFVQAENVIHQQLKINIMPNTQSFLYLFRACNECYLKQEEKMKKLKYWMNEMRKLGIEVTLHNLLYYMQHIHPFDAWKIYQNIKREVPNMKNHEFKNDIFSALLKNLKFRKYYNLPDDTSYDIFMKILNDWKMYGMSFAEITEARHENTVLYSFKQFKKWDLFYAFFQ
eukprot:UN31975